MLYVAVRNVHMGRGGQDRCYYVDLSFDVYVWFLVWRSLTLRDQCSVLSEPTLSSTLAVIRFTIDFSTYKRLLGFIKRIILVLYRRRYTPY